MDLFKDDKNYKGSKDGKIQGGGFPAMIKERKRKLPELEANIAKIFKDYTGELVLIVRMEEDENGHAVGHHQVIAGVSPIKHQMKMMSALDDVKDEILNGMVDGVGDVDPSDMGDLVKEILGGLIEDIDRREAKRKGKK